VKLISGRYTLEFQRIDRLSVPNSGVVVGWRKSAAEEFFVKDARLLAAAKRAPNVTANYAE
jgi:hypothetical protein